jgi:hypothetical protein
MAALLSLDPRHERRARLVFDRALAPAAVTAVTYYAVANSDGQGSHPSVVAAIAVPGVSAAVDLVLGDDIVDGALYTVTVTSVPMQDASTASGSLPLRIGLAQSTDNKEISAFDVDALLYGVDCVWNGTDYVETSGGDLAVHAGPDVVRADLRAACLSNGLPWDAEHGARPRRYVDASSPSVPALKGDLLRAIYVDDRVRVAAVTPTIDEAAGEAHFDVEVHLVGLGDVVTDRIPIRVS